MLKALSWESRKKSLKKKILILFAKNCSIEVDSKLKGKIIVLIVLRWNRTP